MTTSVNPRAVEQTTADSTNQSWTIHVGNLSFKTLNNDLAAFFNEACGPVEDVYIPVDVRTQQSRGFAFVRFSTLEAFNAALHLDGSRLDERQLRIGPARSNSSVPTVATSPKTQVVHCKKSKYDVYIGRPSDWGNPFVIGKDGDRTEVIRKYRQWIMRQPDLLARARRELRGQRIACWCAPEACHGDVLAEIADGE